MKYIKLGFVLIVCPTIATLLAEWLKTVQWAAAWSPAWDYLTGPIAVPRVALYVLGFGIGYFIVDQLYQWDKAKRVKTAQDAAPVEPPPAPASGNGNRAGIIPPKVKLSKVEEDVMIELCRSPRHEANSIDIFNKVKSHHSELAVEQAIDELHTTYKFVSLSYPSRGRYVSFTPKGRKHAVDNGYDLV